MPTPIDGKGKILNGLSMFWFGLTKDIVKNHVITTDINEYPNPSRATRNLKVARCLSRS